MIRNLSLGLLLAAVSMACLGAAAQESGSARPSGKTVAPVTHEDSAARAEGEKRFRANCGRCHMAPHKFPPRMMATVIRHMRVRATLTDDDMRLILQYMTE